MKILLICFSNNYDLQLLTYSLYEELKAKDVDAYTCCISNPKCKIDFGRNNYFFNAPKKPGISLGMMNFPELHRICKFINKERFDVIYFESLHIWNLYIMKRFKKKITIFHSIHDVIPHEGKLSFFISKFNNLIFKYAHKVIVRSRTSYDYCLRTAKISSQKVFYMPIGRKWGEYSPCKHSKRILFFGRLTKYKGLDCLFEICKRMPNTSFVVVGKAINKEDELLFRKISSLDNVYGKSEYVSSQEMVQFFNDSDCIILPYNSATQSGVIVESYSSSRPCIAFNVGGIGEQIIDGKTGYLVERDIDLFVEAIDKFLHLSNREIDDMCFNAYTFGKNHYASEVVAGKMVELMSSCSFSKGK